jgi:hypothetical protein
MYYNNKVWIMRTGPLFILLWKLHTIVLKTKATQSLKDNNDKEIETRNS